MATTERDPATDCHPVLWLGPTLFLPRRMVRNSHILKLGGFLKLVYPKSSKSLEEFSTETTMVTRGSPISRLLSWEVCQKRRQLFRQV
jgi:hypothetical protein